MNVSVDTATVRLTHAIDFACTAFVCLQPVFQAFRPPPVDITFTPVLGWAAAEGEVVGVTVTRRRTSSAPSSPGR